MHSGNPLGIDDVSFLIAPTMSATSSRLVRKKRDSRRVKFWNGPKRQRELSIPAVQRSIEADETMPVFLVKGLVER